MQFDIFEKYLSSFKILSFNVGRYQWWWLYRYLWSYFNQSRNRLLGDELLINTSQNNHFINLNLIGTKSNCNAIGTYKSLFILGHATKEPSLKVEGKVMASSIRFSSIFGTGQDAKIDSVLIFWPHELSSILIFHKQKPTSLKKENVLLLNPSDQVRPSCII